MRLRIVRIDTIWVGNFHKHAGLERLVKWGVVYYPLTDKERQHVEEYRNAQD